MFAQQRVSADVASKVHFGPTNASEMGITSDVLFAR